MDNGEKILLLILALCVGTWLALGLYAVLCCA
jgi:hypothetical protein